jgi:hypothetical protein
MLKSLREYVKVLGYWVWLVFGSIILSAIGVYIYFSGKSNIPTWGWVGVLLAGLIISCFLAFHRVRVQRDEYKKRIEGLEAAKANMVVKVVENRKGDVVSHMGADDDGMGGEIFVHGHPWFTRVHIANDPSDCIEAVEVEVAAHIGFYDSSDKLCFPSMIGRWAETLEIAQGGQPIEIEQLRIPPTGRPYILDIGLKYHDEDEFYGYNNDTPRKSTVGFRDGERALGKGNYRVKVEL